MRAVLTAVSFASAAALAGTAEAQPWLGRGVAPGARPAASAPRTSVAQGGTTAPAYGGFSDRAPSYGGFGDGNQTHAGHHHGGGPAVYGGLGYGGLGYGGVGYGGYGYGGHGYSAVGPGYSTSFDYYHGPVGGFGGYGYGLGGYGPGYPAYGYGGLYGTAVGPYGVAYGPDPLNNSILQREHDAQWQAWSAQQADAYLAARSRDMFPTATALPNDGDATAGAALPAPSSPEAKLRSLRAQAQGDAAFLKQDYRHAYERYKAAVEQARDRGEAYFRLGYALVALGRFDAAVQHFRRGLEVEPSLGLVAAPLDAIYGEDNKLAKLAHVERVTLWTKDDLRDPSRLFLLGLLLHYDGDARSREFLENAWKLSGGSPALAALLNPETGDAAPVAAAPVAVPLADVAAETAEPIAPGPVLAGPPSGNAEEPETAAADADLAGSDLPPLPEPPPLERPLGEGPLFPLPSEVGMEADPSGPPLPRP